MEFYRRYGVEYGVIRYISDWHMITILRVFLSYEAVLGVVMKVELIKTKLRKFLSHGPRFSFHYSVLAYFLTYAYSTSSETESGRLMPHFLDQVIRREHPPIHLKA